MSENAKWRNDIRDKNIKKYKQDDKKEDDERTNARNGPGEIFRYEQNIKLCANQLVIKFFINLVP